MSSMTSVTATDVAVASSSVPSTTLACLAAQPASAVPTALQQQRAAFARSATLGPQSPALRPEELRVKPWYAVGLEEGSHLASKESPLTGPLDQSCAPAGEVDPAAASTRTSSIESECQPVRASVPRKAYMDLSDAIALLDETCPNPEASPLMTPRTPRTPLTPHPRNKRARSKSSDNSSNYSSERLNERSIDKSQEKERKRPFLKKIGISMTEDRPLLAKLAPRIIGKPYLEKIGPSRAVDKPFLEKIGSSRTLDKFTFDTPRTEKRREPVDSTSSRNTIAEEPERRLSVKERRDEIRAFSTGERRRSGKNFLLKMYSFETEDLEGTALSMKAPHRDPLRGASLDDVLDSGPSSMPRINELGAMTNSDAETPSASAAELVRCRVTTSEEIISSNSCLNSPMEIISWGNSPRRRGTPGKNSPARAGEAPADKENSVPNSPTKRAHAPSVTPERVTAVYKDLEVVKNGRQTSEDILDKRKSRHDGFERRGGSSDNLTKERVVTPVFAEIGARDLNGKGSSNSVVSTGSSVRQLHDRFESQETFTETYAEFKRRTQGHFQTSNALKRLVAREKNVSPSLDLGLKDKDVSVSERAKPEGSPKVRSRSVENERPREKLEVHNRRTRARSVLRKQAGVDHSNCVNEPEVDSGQRKKMIHEPSQETLDLLSELQKVKSLLKTPSVDKTYEDFGAENKPLPKRILLTDKEFCLSIERENSVRRPSRINTLEKRDTAGERSPDRPAAGSALFEKRCLSLDYADEERSLGQKTEPRALSLASARSPRSEDILEASEIALITSDSKSYSSDVFNSPTDEVADGTPAPGVSVELEVRKIECEIRNSRLERDAARKPSEERPGEKTEQSPRHNHCAEATEPAAQPQLSPRRRAQTQSDSGLEVASSPKATAFRMKKRLGRISVEETLKQESFAVSKAVDAKEVAVQKRAKCLPL